MLSYNMFIKKCDPKFKILILLVFIFRTVKSTVLLNVSTYYFVSDGNHLTFDLVFQKQKVFFDIITIIINNQYLHIRLY